jgi:uncharacterized protein (TIGR02001 family)
MQNIIVKAIVLCVLTNGLFAQTVALNGKFGVTSDYVFRGMTQNANAASVSGGVDVYYQGIFAGMSVANVVGGSEEDYFAGYMKQFGGLGLSVGYFAGKYPKMKLLNYEESTLSLSYQFENSFNITLNYAHPLTKGNEEMNNKELVVNYKALSVSAGKYNTFGKYVKVSLAKKVDKNSYTINYSDFKHSSNSILNEKIVFVSAQRDFSLL